MNRLRVALAAWAWGLSFTASADALEWLHRMNEAVRDATYHGTAVYRNGDQLETLRIFHRAEDGVEQERMYSLSGQNREILREADKVTCILPDQKAVLVDHQGLRGLLPNLPRAAFEELRGYYELIDVSGEKRVAGRSCREIRILARDIYRYNYQLCLDTQNALPLDIRLMGEDGEVLEQVLFTQIEFSESLASDLFKSSIDTRDFHHLSQQAFAASTDEVLQGWELSEVPPGFRLATREQQIWPGFEHPVTQFLYSDGLAAVSIFATPEQLPEEALQGLTRMGGVNAYGRMLGSFHVTVVGEVPQATVRFFGDNLRQVSSQP